MLLFQNCQFLIIWCRRFSVLKIKNSIGFIVVLNKLTLKFVCWYGLNVCSTPTPNSYVENLISKVMVLGGGVFGKWLCLKGRALRDLCSYKRSPRELAHSLTMRGYSEKSETQKRDLTQLCWHPDLKLLVARSRINSWCS